ncbi:protein takeout-like [Bactrocera tryoni]|uniref:protein takeout-like n=1 Tax=Bactrocera tryoni TaxID=59916 RepID=UPI001A96D114|nr:protein takeout-like [Bactrocera tryoni]
MMSSYKFLTLLYLIGIFHINTNADMPPEIEKCRAGDVDCIAKILPYLLQNYTNGIPEIGLTDIEKLSLNNIIITKAKEQSPVTLNLAFKKMYLHGIRNVTVQRVVGFGKDLLSSKFETYVTIPNLVVDGEYVSSGKVLLLPMDAIGFAKIEMKNTRLSLKFKFDEECKDGKQYAKIKALKCKLTPELIVMQFDNLFNGNKQLGESLNQMINDNWKILWADMESQVNEAVAGIVKRLLANIISVLPYDDFYRED